METNLIEGTMTFNNFPPRPSSSHCQTMTPWAQGRHLSLRCREDPWGLPIEHDQKMGTQPQQTPINQWPVRDLDPQGPRTIPQHGAVGRLEDLQLGKPLADRIFELKDRRRWRDLLQMG